MYVCTYVRMYVWMYGCMYVCTYVWMDVYAGGGVHHRDAHILLLLHTVRRRLLNRTGQVHKRHGRVEHLHVCMNMCIRMHVRTYGYLHVHLLLGCALGATAGR